MGSAVWRLSASPIRPAAHAALPGAGWVYTRYSGHVACKLSASDVCLLVWRCHHKQPVTVTPTPPGALLNLTVCHRGILPYVDVLPRPGCAWRPPFNTAYSAQICLVALEHVTQAPKFAFRTRGRFASRQVRREYLTWVPSEPRRRQHPVCRQAGNVWSAAMSPACLRHSHSRPLYRWQNAHLSSLMSSSSRFCVVGQGEFLIPVTMWRKSWPRVGRALLGDLRVLAVGDSQPVYLHFLQRLCFPVSSMPPPKAPVVSSQEQWPLCPQPSAPHGTHLPTAPCDPGALCPSPQSGARVASSSGE